VFTRIYIIKYNIGAVLAMASNQTWKCGVLLKRHPKYFIRWLFGIHWPLHILSMGSTSCNERA